MRTKRIKLYSFNELSYPIKIQVLYEYRAKYKQNIWIWLDFQEYFKSNDIPEPEFLADGTLYTG